MISNKAEITFKSHGVTFDGITLLDADEVQKAIQAMHANFEMAIQQVASERDELMVEVEELRSAENECR
tara:strand:- start:2854 stop:3060 length:207 start_codon:yes stop_codon:yes gene_type:complete